VSDWIIDVVDTLGHAGLVGLMLLECVFPPIPSEAILPAVRGPQPMKSEVTASGRIRTIRRTSSGVR
jgi:hypothetical protein